MSMDYIRKTYGVPAKRGGRVEYSRGPIKAQGTIIGSRGAYLRVRIDGFRHAFNYHPTDCITYLNGSGVAPVQCAGGCARGAK